jgi:hypothetical protein
MKLLKDELAKRYTENRNLKEEYICIKKDPNYNGRPAHINRARCNAILDCMVRPQRRTKGWVKKFAWLPIRASNKKLIWLSYYWEYVEVWHHKFATESRPENEYVFMLDIISRHDFIMMKLTMS